MTKTPRLLLAPLLLALAAAPGQASAAPKDAPQPSLSVSLTGSAKEAFASAEILLNNSDFPRALAKYRQAYELSKDPRLLFNMAVCERNLKHYASMQALLARYEQEAGASMPKDDRADVDNALAAIRNLVGALRLTASEDGAYVSIDGQPSGTTPLAHPIVVDLGPHVVTVSKAGFTSVVTPVVVQGGSEQPVSSKLIPILHVAQLVVSAEDGATILVDGKTIAKGRFDGQVASGRHEVQVTEPGKIAYRSQVELRDDEMRSMQVTLENEKHQGTLLWPWIAGGGAVVAGAIVGGYFLFKSPQETQAPLVGTLGAVRFTSARAVR